MGPSHRRRSVPVRVFSQSGFGKLRAGALRCGAEIADPAIPRCAGQVFSASADMRECVLPASGNGDAGKARPQPAASPAFPHFRASFFGFDVLPLRPDLVSLSGSGDSAESTPGRFAWAWK